MKAIFVATIVLALAAGLHAQNVTVAGTVADSSGGALPGVEVKATQTDTGFIRSAVSDERGLYTLSNLPVGPYRLEATSQGFSRFVQTGIILQVGSNPTINISLQVGAVAQQVEVKADAAMVETRSTGVGQVITNQNVLSLPLNGRNVTELVMLSGGVSDAYQAGNFVSNRQYPVVAISVAGGSPGGTYYAMDGGSHNDPGNNLNLAVPFPDALQEFKVETGAVSARYGQHANAVVNLVTKTGTNVFHGSAFEFVRNGIFNAQNRFATTKDSLKRNQFGGTFGGPILKNKLFFFAGYQGTITRSDPKTLRAFVPTAAMLAGDFRAAASPACNAGAQKTLKAPTGASYSFVPWVDLNGNKIQDANEPGNTISPGAFNPVSLNYEKSLPASTDPCGLYLYGFPTPSDDKQLIARGDYQISDAQSIFGRYFRAVYNASNFFNGNALTTTSIGTRNTGESLVLGHTYAINPTMVNTLRFTYLRPNNSRFAVPFFSPDQLGANITPTPFAGNFTSLGVTNAFAIGNGSTNNAIYNYRAWGVNNDLDIVRGKHDIAVGVAYLYETVQSRNSQFSNGQITINGQRTGIALSDFLLGEVATYIQGADGVLNEGKNYLGIYAQDAWRLSTKLSINYGLRWEPDWPIYNKDNRATQFDEAAFAAGTKSAVYVNAPPGLTFPGDAGFPGSAHTESRLRIFNPRFGIVYDPRGQGREVVRAAYGVFSDSQPMFDHITFMSNPPWGGQVQRNGVLLSDPWIGFPGGNPFPFTLSSTTTFPTSGAYALEPRHLKPTYYQQWNFSVQKQLGNDWSVTLTYLGNKGTHILGNTNLNPAVFVPGNCTAGQFGLTTAGACSQLSNINSRRRLSFINATNGAKFANITQAYDGGNSSYNGAVFAVQKRLTKGYSVLSNYTWSHCINLYDAVQIQSNGSPITDPSNPNLDRGNCNADIRHLFNLTGVLAMPKFDSRAVQILAGNWQLSNIFRAQSGVPLNITSGQDLVLNGNSGQRPNQIGNPNLDNPTPDAWFNKAAFAPNAPGQFGTTARNSLTGPGSWNLDVALSRIVPIKESHTIELRAEAFNLLNHVRYNIPVTALNSTDFGRITSAKDPRIMQFAVKYSF